MGCRRLYMLALTVVAAWIPSAVSASDRVSIRITATPVTSALSMIGDMANASVEWLGEPETRLLTLDLRDVSLDEAVDRILGRRSRFIVAAAATGAPRRIVVLPPSTPNSSRSPDTTPIHDPDIEDDGGKVPASALRDLDHEDPAVRQRLLHQVRDFHPSDVRRAMILDRLLTDGDVQLRAEAAELAGGEVPWPAASEEPPPLQPPH